MGLSLFLPESWPINIGLQSRLGSGSGRQDDPAPREIVGVELELDAVARREPDEVEPVLAGSAGDAAMSVRQRDAVGAVLHDFDDNAFGVNLIGVHEENLERRT